MKYLTSIYATILGTLVFTLSGNAQEISFDRDRYIELNTAFGAGEKFDIAVDYNAWADLNDNGQQDEGELFTPAKEGNIQRFYSSFQGAKSVKIYGSFTEIILRNNGINSIDVSRMPQLTYLELKGNNLSSLDLKKLINLESLSIRENNFTSIDLSNQPKLELLEAIYNQLETVNLANKPNMYFVAIAHNRFSEESFARLVADLPTMNSRSPGDIFGHFPVETEKNIISKKEVLNAKAKNWIVYTWSIKANTWIPYAGIQDATLLKEKNEFKAVYHDGHIIIYDTDKDLPIELYDTAGNRILSFEADRDLTMYKTAPLADGFYLIKQGKHITKLAVKNN